MQFKKLKSKQLLAESRDQEEVFNKTYHIDDFELRYSSFNYVDELKDNVLTNLIVKNLTKPIKTSLGHYNSEENLTLMYSINADNIAVISLGEYRRELYRIYLEGIWNIENYS